MGRMGKTGRRRKALMLPVPAGHRVIVPVRNMLSSLGLIQPILTRNENFTGCSSVEDQLHPDLVAFLTGTGPTANAPSPTVPTTKQEQQRKVPPAVIVASIPSLGEWKGSVYHRTTERHHESNDGDETGQKRVENEWREWFQDAAKLTLECVPTGSVGIFQQTDFRLSTSNWVDHGFLLQQVAERLGGFNLVWHKFHTIEQPEIAQEAAPPFSTATRPGSVLPSAGHSHILCFTRDHSSGDAKKASPFLSIVDNLDFEKSRSPDVLLASDSVHAFIAKYIAKQLGLAASEAEGETEEAEGVEAEEGGGAAEEPDVLPSVVVPFCGDQNGRKMLAACNAFGLRVAGLFQVDETVPEDVVEKKSAWLGELLMAMNGTTSDATMNEERATAAASKTTRAVEGASTTPTAEPSSIPIGNREVAVLDALLVMKQGSLESCEVEAGGEVCKPEVRKESDGERLHRVNKALWNSWVESTDFKEEKSPSSLPSVKSQETRRAAFFASMPDVSEFPENTLEFWENWFQNAAKLTLDCVPADSVAIFFQTDIRLTPTHWVDKSYLVQKAAQEIGCELVWHKVCCRTPAGKCSTKMSGYSHLLCFRGKERGHSQPPFCCCPQPFQQQEQQQQLFHGSPSFPDVIEDVGHKSWARATGSTVCVHIASYLKDDIHANLLVNPFCGEGQMLAAWNSFGLHSFGIELSNKRAIKARKLQLDRSGEVVRCPLAVMKKGGETGGSKGK